MTPTPTPAFDPQGRRVFRMQTGQFMLVVEGVRGPSALPLGTSMQPGVDGRPDLQIQSTKPLGNGSVAVCDVGMPNPGGVPAIITPDFSAGDSFITNALNDFACRFGVFSRASPCTRSDASGDSRMINAAADMQFCYTLTTATKFPPGESIVTTRLRDVQGNLGPTAQIVVRVATPTPGP